jgi:hypothetical protein
VWPYTQQALLPARKVKVYKRRFGKGNAASIWQRVFNALNCVTLLESVRR